MKNLKNLGKALSQAEQKEINGGKKLMECSSDSDCGTNAGCSSNTTGTFETKVICYQSACLLVAC